MKYLPLILLFLVVSCTTQKRCLIKFPPDTVINTVVTHDVFFMDTIIQVEIPGDTVVVESAWSDDFVWTDISEHLFPPTETHTERHISPLRAEVALAYSEAWVENSILKMRLIQKDSILQFKLDSVTMMVIDSITTDQTKIIEVIVAPKQLKTYKVLFWFTLGLLLLIFVLMFIFLKMK